MLRRDFLKYAAVTAGAAGAAYTQADKLIPYLDSEDQVLPGVSTWYATSCRECPAGCGLIVRNREGRIVKVEGNPLHPINEGRLCARGQAALQAIYDPDRFQHPLRRSQGGEERISWDDAIRSVSQELSKYRGRTGIISDLQSGSLATLITEWLGVFRSAHSLIYEPFNYEATRDANRQVFGRDAIPDYRLDQCDMIVSFAADFTTTWVSPVKFIRRYADTREPRDNRMSKSIFIGPRLDSTGFTADEYILVPPGQERLIALSMLSVIESEGLARGQAPSGLTLFSPDAVGPKLGVKPDQIRRIARQFAQARSPLALAGSPLGNSTDDIEIALAASLLNVATGSSTIDFSRTHALGQTARTADIASFMDALENGAIQALIIIGVNPAYSLPLGYHFEEITRKLPLVVSLSPFRDETSQLATWVLPSSTYLEEWGDYEPEVGIMNIIQPTMGRLYNTLPTGDILIRLAREAGSAPSDFGGATDFLTYLQKRWATHSPGKTWEDAVRQGGDWGPPSASTAATTPASVGTAPPFTPPSFDTEAKLYAFAHPLLYDGRGANKRWLQEIPDTVNHVVWGSWVEMHPATATKLGLQEHQALELRSPAGVITPPVLPYQGVHPQTLAVPFGQGHTAYGRFATGIGVNTFHAIGVGRAYSPSQSVRVALRPAKDHIVSTDGSVEQHGRRIIEVLKLSELSHRHPEELDWPTEQGYHRNRDLYTAHKHIAHRWAMVVDMSRCVGCEACMAACYAENNLAVVGKEWVRQGREMEWIWIDRYYDWNSPGAPAHYLVSLCQHCDAAPCEPVCPVFAAVHDQEGLNQQIYNRCIGTRYCSNNCPYKVRRFNWRNYSWPEPLNWQCNPDVTVRQRGVMEKCTFCIQRIRHAQNRAKAEGRLVRDGEIIPACAQTCPAGVFVFGDLMDPNSRISKLVADHPRRYQLLKELNTKPAVFYLSRVVNDIADI